MSLSEIGGSTKQINANEQNLNVFMLSGGIVHLNMNPDCTASMQICDTLYAHCTISEEFLQRLGK